MTDQLARALDLPKVLAKVQTYVGMGEPQLRDSVSWGDGVYKSTDGGETWDLVLEIDENTGVVDMVMDPTNPSLWFSFDLDPAVLAGNYVSLRTNSLAVSFSDFTVTAR